MAMSSLTDLGERGINGIAFDLDPLSLELEAYGEAEAAAWLKRIDQSVHAQVSELALSKSISFGCTTDKAICLAAVEVFEGSSRELRRKKRVYK